MLLGVISLFPFLPLTPNKILINVVLCLLTTSRCGGIRSNLLNLNFRAPHTRTPNYLSRSSQIGFLTISVTGPIFSSFIFLYVFFPLMATSSPESPSKSWPVSKARFKHPPCSRNPFNSFHLPMIVPSVDSSKHFYFYLFFGLYHIIL